MDRIFPRKRLNCLAPIAQDLIQTKTDSKTPDSIARKNTDTMKRPKTPAALEMGKWLSSVKRSHSMVWRSGSRQWAGEVLARAFLARRRFRGVKEAVINQGGKR